jgi:formylglycine-generating enzyme required for sulfatase activity
VRKLYQALKKETWISPWLDEEQILPGMDWDYEIYKAFRDADVIIACLSQESVAKEGYVQREFKRALSYAEEKPEGTIYVIPLRLDDCTPPRKLNKYQWVDYFESSAKEKLLKSLKIRAENLEILGEVVSKKIEKVAPAVVARKSELNVPKANNYKVHIFAGMEFLKIPAGEFYMGADDLDDYEGASKPEHLVYLDYDYYIARFPLTNRLYARMALDRIVSRKNALHPVVNVSWYDAWDYVEWINHKHGSELPRGLRFCLPSEAEWEKAARGPDGRMYPWGDEFSSNKCNSTESGLGFTSLVGKFSPQGDSFYGASDMAGNVWEWTRSLWGDDWDKSIFNYPYNSEDGREEELAEKYVLRVLRGGSFEDGRNNMRCAYRLNFAPDHGDDYYGFRLCVSPIS